MDYESRRCHCKNPDKCFDADHKLSNADLTVSCPGCQKQLNKGCSLHFNDTKYYCYRCGYMQLLCQFEIIADTCPTKDIFRGHCTAGSWYNHPRKKKCRCSKFQGVGVTSVCQCGHLRDTHDVNPDTNFETKLDAEGGIFPTLVYNTRGANSPSDDLTIRYTPSSTIPSSKAGSLVECTQNSAGIHATVLHLILTYSYKCFFVCTMLSLGKAIIIEEQATQYWHGKQSDLIRNVKAHYGLLLHRVIGDGNCLYTAFAIVLEHNCEIMTNWKMLRKEVFIIAIHYYNYYHNYYYLFICSPCRL